MNERPPYLSPLPNPWSIHDYRPETGASYPTQAPSLPQEGTDRPPRTPVRTAQGEKQPRVELAGLIASVPRFGTTPRGQARLHFVLATHHPVGERMQTTYSTILAFGERAQQLKDRLTKGSPVACVAYQHERERTGRDGTTRTVVEYYATNISLR